MKKYFVCIIASILAFAQVQAIDFIPEYLDGTSTVNTQSESPIFTLSADDLLETTAGPSRILGINHNTGDVNGDGNITISDVTCLIDILLGQFTDYDTRIRCDMNFDNNITIYDLSLLIDYLLNDTKPEKIKEGYDYVWDEDALPEVHIEVSLAEWNRLLALYDENHYTRQYVMADMTFIKGNDTTRVDSVGLRLKGNSSRHRPEGRQNFVPHQTNTTLWRRTHFGINLRKYVDDDAHTIQGIRKIHLRFCSNDPAYVREKYCYDLFKRAGVWTAIRDEYCRVWIHVEGDAREAYFGVYLLAEPIDKRYLKDRKDLFGASNGYLWKCRHLSTGGAGLNNPNGDFWYDDDSDDMHTYTLKTQTEEFDSARVQFADFMTKLKSLDDNTFYTWIQEVTDVDLLLKTYAVNVVLGMWDDYWNNANNYYLYFSGKHLTGYKVFFIPYDYDSSLGNCSISGYLTDSGRQNPLQWGNNIYPLISRILRYNVFRQIYIKHLKMLVDEKYALSDRESAQARIMAWQEFIGPYVSNDTGREMVIEDQTAAFSNHPEYNLLNDDENNFFTVKAESINALP